MAEFVESDPGRSEALETTRENIQYFAEHMPSLKEQHGGRYVIVHDGRVLAASKRAEEAWATVGQEDVHLEFCVMQYVPKPGQPFFF